MEVHVSDEQVVLANGVDICVDTFGDPDDPTVLLIAGMASSMDWWEPEFCRATRGGRIGSSSATTIGTPDAR